MTHQQLLGLARMAMAQRAAQTPAQIMGVVRDLATLPFMDPAPSEENIVEAVRQLEREFEVVLGPAHTIQASGHKPWLRGRAHEINFRYWQRYRDYLIAGGMSEHVVNAVATVTDTIVDLAGDPTTEGAWSRRGLVVGHVQSGKTANYLGVINKAADAGYRVVILVAGVHNNLRSQTQERVDQGFVGRDDTDFDGCMKIVQEVTQDKSLYLANSMNSLRIEGQKTISFEICQQFGWDVPDVIIIPGGNLGNVSALGRGFEMMIELGLINRRPRIVVAQAANANPLYLAAQRGFDKLEPVRAQKTEASAIQIGNPVSYERAVTILKKYQGEVYQVTEQQLADAAHRADLTGLYCDPHTGVALGALEQMVDAKRIGADERVVIISTAHGLKFSEFKTRYHEKQLAGVESTYANPIIHCAADADQVRDALAKRLG